VLAQLEHAVTERPRGVEHRVAVLEPAIPEGHQHLTLGHEAPVVIRDPLARSAHVVGSLYS
jgi:hypothetical protein